jgi:hypothetical protein
LELLTLFNKKIQDKLCPHKFNEGNIILLYKKNDPELLKNYRPISLLNTDYKLFTSILSERLIKTLRNKISSNQHAFLTKRLIHDNIMAVQLMIDLCNLAKEENNGGYLAFMDQEKAYDRVNHKFLWETLEAIGIPCGLIDIIKSLYADASSSLLINGQLAGHINCKRGVRQGDSLSCILFVCVMEAFETYLESQTEIKAIEINHQRTGSFTLERFKLYADDTVAAVANIDSLNSLIHHIHVFEKASGSKLNKDKSEILPIGISRIRTKPDNGMLWVPEKQPIRHLGCPVRVRVIGLKKSTKQLPN